MRDPLSCNFWPTNFFFPSSFSLVRSSSLVFFFPFSFTGFGLLHYFFFFFFFFSLGSGCWVLGKKKKKSCIVTGVGPQNGLKNSEWWYQTTLVFRVMIDEWWVMNDENWVMSDEWWVMEIEWSKKVNQTSPKISLLNRHISKKIVFL